MIVEIYRHHSSTPYMVLNANRAIMGRRRGSLQQPLPQRVACSVACGAALRWCYTQVAGAYAASSRPLRVCIGPQKIYLRSLPNAALPRDTRVTAMLRHDTYRQRAAAIIFQQRDMRTVVSPRHRSLNQHFRRYDDY